MRKTPFRGGYRGPRQAPRKEELHKVNQRITAPLVRVVGDNVDGGIYPIREALKMAEDLGLDLVEISPAVNPPVCKILDYSKFLYEQKKKQKEIKANAAKVIIKEIRLTPNTDDHDFNFKVKHAMKFLQDGAKVKVDVFFRGRSIIYKEQGELILAKFATELEDYGKVEKLPVLEGKRMIMILAPKGPAKK